MSAAVLEEMSALTVASNQTRSSLIGWTSPGVPRPSIPSRDAATASARSASVTTWIVLELSARPWAVSSFWPLMESNSFV